MAKFICDTDQLAETLKLMPDRDRGEYLRQSIRLIHTGKFDDDTMPAWATPVDRETDDADIDSPYTKVFEQFWSLYPRKKNKGAAFRAWQKIKGNKQSLLKSCAKALEWQIKSEQWQNPQYIPYPSTYLNGRGWEDSPEEGPDGGGDMVLNALGYWEKA